MEKELEMLEEIKEETPVFVLEESIPDILALNDLQSEIEKKQSEKEAKEQEVKDVETKREELDEKIGIINNGQHINEVALNLKNLRDLVEELDKRNSELEDICGELRIVEEDKKSLDESTRRMVEEMTKDYNRKIANYTDLVDRYRSTSNISDYEESTRVVDELNKYKKFNSFDDILKNIEAKEEEKKEEKPLEEKEEIKEEPKVEEKVESEIDLNEVKVDSIEEKEPENLEVSTPTEEPKVESQKEEFSTPSFDDIPLDDVSTEKEISPLLFSKIDKIADSNKKGINSTIDVFNPKKVESEDKTLSLAA